MYVLLRSTMGTNGDLCVSNVKMITFVRNIPGKICFVPRRIALAIVFFFNQWHYVKQNIITSSLPDIFFSNRP